MRGFSLRRRFAADVVVAVDEKSQGPATDRKRDQPLDADGADHLDAGGDQHGVDKRSMHRGFRRPGAAVPDPVLAQTAMGRKLHFCVLAVFSTERCPT
jgi:hypothetical protein